MGIRPATSHFCTREQTHSPNRSLKIGKGKGLNVYTDSTYAFATAHVHGAIYQERGLLMAQGKTIKNKPEILNPLKTLWLPRKLAITPYPGHQKAAMPEAKGSQQGRFGCQGSNSQSYRRFDFPTA